MTKWTIEIDGVVQAKTVWAFTHTAAITQAAQLYHVEESRVICYEAN